MDSPTETGSHNVDSSSWIHTKSSSLAETLIEINQNVQKMLRLIEDNEPDSISTEKFLCLYQSLGETYNNLNQKLLKSLTFDLNVLCSNRNHKSIKTSCDEMMPSFELNCEVETETSRRELEARKVIELERKLSDSSKKIEILESELEVSKELLEVSEAEVSKLVEMLSECKTEKANSQKDNADLLDSLREELRLRDIQIEEMEEYLNQVSVEDTELMSESRIENNVIENSEKRVEELESIVELQRNVISEREKEKREAIRELCFSLDHYMSKYKELVRSLSITPRYAL